MIHSVVEPERVGYESRIARMFHDFELSARPRDLARLRAIASGER